MRGERVAYLDSSALVKLVVAEPESSALRRSVRRHPLRISCGLARVEVLRAVAGHGSKATARARRVLTHVRIIKLDDPLLDAASDLRHPRLRTLDAIHIAAALTLGTTLDALITYDSRMAEAAEALGLPVVSPG